MCAACLPPKRSTHPGTTEVLLKLTKTERDHVLQVGEAFRVKPSAAKPDAPRPGSDAAVADPAPQNDAAVADKTPAVHR